MRQCDYCEREATGSVTDIIHGVIIPICDTCYINMCDEKMADELRHGDNLVDKRGVV